MPEISETKTVAKTYSGIFLLVLAVFLIFNLATLPDYGMTWDEPAQQHIGKVAMGYLTGATKHMEFLRDDLVYYGPFFEIVNQYFGNSLLESFRIAYVDAFHVLILLTAALGLFYLYKFAAKMFSEKIAFFACLFLMLYPRFVAHAHYNSKDIPLFAGFVITLYYLYSGFREKNWKQIILAGLVFGLTLAVRIDAILLLPVFFLPLIFLPKFFAEFRKNFLLGSAFIASSAVFVFLAWPSLWNNPGLFFQALWFFVHHGWQGSVLYLGEVYKASQLPWHYAPLYLALATPVAILICFGFGLYFVFKELRKKTKVLEYTLILSWFFWRLIIAMVPGAVRYDGIRHYLVIVPAMMIIASLGLNYIWGKIAVFFPKVKFWGRVAVGGVVFLSLLIEFAIIFPFGDSYFNEAARLIFPKHLEKKFEIEYWGATLRQGTAWLNENAEPNSAICVPMATHLMQFYPLRADLSVGCVKGAKYLMFFTRYTYLPADLESVYKYSDQTPIYTISRYHSDLLYIFKF